MRDVIRHICPLASLLIATLAVSACDKQVSEVPLTIELVELEEPRYDSLKH
jgi:hypothetical protein